MASIYQAPSMNVPVAIRSNSGLKISTIIFGVLGFITWGLSIGFMLGWENTDLNSENICLHGGAAKILFGWYVSVPTNVAMVYVTARIIFVITSRSFPSPALLADLHECVARLVAFTVLSLTMWAVSLSWLTKDNCSPNVVYHGCNYGYVVSAIVAGLAGGLWTNASAVQGPAGVARGPAPPPPQAQAHYNQAYSHHPGHYR